MTVALARFGELNRGEPNAIRCRQDQNGFGNLERATRDEAMMGRSEGDRQRCRFGELDAVRNEPSLGGQNGTKGGVRPLQVEVRHLIADFRVATAA